MYLSCDNELIKLEDCITFGKRLVGFMFRKKKIIEGKRFPKCNSIHTFFMFQKIDVIMADKNNQIIKMYPNLKSWKIILPKKNVYYVYELPLKTCAHYKVKDILKIKESD